VRRARCGQRELDGLCFDYGSSQQQKTLDDIAQFANISRPCVLLERINCLLGKWNRLPSILRADLAGKVLDQRGQVFNALAQRRQLNGKDHDAMIEIAPELSGFN
jgi:hypothetical protein